MCKIAYIVVCILLVYCFHVQCVWSSPSVISNNSAIAHDKAQSMFCTHFETVNQNHIATQIVLQNSNCMFQELQLISPVHK